MNSKVILLLLVLIGSFLFVNPTGGQSSSSQHEESIAEGDVEIYGKEVGINIGKEKISVQSEKIDLLYYDGEIDVSILENKLNMKNKLTIDDVYNIPEKQEEIYSPNKDLKDSTIFENSIGD